MRGGFLLRARGLSQLLPSTGYVCPVCGVTRRREQCAHKLLLLEIRSGKRRFWVLTAMEPSSSAGHGDHQEMEESFLLTRFLNWNVQWKTFCFQARHNHCIPCNLGGKEITEWKGLEGTSVGHLVQP